MTQAVSKTYRQLNLLLKITVAILGAIIAWHIFWRIKYNDSYFYEVALGGFEMYVNWGFQRLMQLGRLYEDPELPPFGVIQYSPLYYYFLMPIAKWLDINVYDPYITMRFLRWAGFVINLITSLIIYLGCNRWLKATTIFSLYAALVSFCVLTSHFYARVDSLYLLLFTVGYLVLLKHNQNRQTIFLIMSAILAVCTLFTKQMGLLSVGLVVFYTLFYLNWRERIYVVLTLILSLAVFLWLLLLNEQLPSVLKNVFMGVNNGLQFDLWIGIFLDPDYRYLFLFLVGLAVLSTLNVILPKFNFAFSSIAPLLCLGFGLLLGLKHGSSVNYFQEFYVATLFMMTQWFNQEKPLMAWPKWKSTTVCLVFIGSIWTSFHVAEWIREPVKDEKFAKEAYADAVKVHQFLVKNTNADYDYYFVKGSKWLCNFSINNTIFPTDYANASSNFKYEIFWKMAKTGQLKYVLVASGDNSGFWRNFQLTDYTLIQELGGYKIYCHKKRLFS